MTQNIANRSTNAIGIPTMSFNINTASLLRLLLADCKARSIASSVSCGVIDQLLAFRACGLRGAA